MNTNTNCTYEKWDSCIGEVIRNTQYKLYITLVDGTSAFAKNCLSLNKGSRVLCTVMKPGDDKFSTQVSVDSVLEYAA